MELFFVISIVGNEVDVTLYVFIELEIFGDGNRDLLEVDGT